MSTLSLAKKIYKTSCGDAATYEVAAQSWRFFFAAYVDEKYTGILDILERARLHLQIDSAHPVTPDEIIFFQSLRASGASQASTWGEVVPFLEDALTCLRPYYFHFFRGDEFKVLDWRDEATVTFFTSMCEDDLSGHILIPMWWEQSGLSYSDLLGAKAL